MFTPALCDQGQSAVCGLSPEWDRSRERLDADSAAATGVDAMQISNESRIQIHRFTQQQYLTLPRTDLSTHFMSTIMSTSRVARGQEEENTHRL